MAGHIAKNTLYLTAASIAQKFFSFIYFTLIARYVGVTGTGLYVTALSFSSLFSILTDLGLTSVLVRESAKDRQKMIAMVNNISALKIILLGVAYVILNLTVRLLDYPANLINLVNWSGLVMIFDSISLTFYGALRSQQNFRYEAVSVVFSQIITIAVGALVLAERLDIVYLIIALGCGSLFNVIYSYLALRRLHHFKFRPYLDPVLVKTIAVWAAPFALAGIFTKVYSYIDVTMISHLLGSRAVGLYSIASKATFAWQFVPMAFAAALYPALSHYFAHNRSRLKETFIRGIRYLAIMAMPISLGIFALADKIIIKIYGAAYEPSILPLQILLISLIFAFLDFPVGALLNAGNRQNLQTLAMGITMVVDIVLNIILLPRLAIIGASLAALAGNMVLVLVGASGVRRLIGVLGGDFWWSLFKNLVAALIMGFILMLIKNPLFNWLIPHGLIMTGVYFVMVIGLGLLVYLALLVIFRLITKDDWADILTILRRQPIIQPVEQEIENV